MASLRIQLIAFWLLLLGVCAGLATVMVVLYENSAGVQVGQARALTQQVCESIARRYQQSLAGAPSAQPNAALLQVVLQLALIEAPHLEGGVWNSASGFVAYAYPTYEGGGVKRDVPDAERPHIAEVARAAAQTQAARTDILRGTREALVLSACPLASPAADTAAWVMTRVAAEAEAALRNLRLGLGALLAVVLASGVWLGSILARAYRHVRRLEAALGAIDAQSESVPRLALTGVEEFDRIVAAINRYGLRLEAALGQARALMQQQAHDQRLTALGRMTGGIAHEIRNPIASMRLKAENALAASPERHAEALQMILGQIERLDHLVQNLLALVQPLQLQAREVRLADWCTERRAANQPRADARGVTLELRSAIEHAVFDPLHLGRAIDNLLENAVRHAPQGGRVELEILRAASGNLLLRVCDDGPGVPTELRDHLFEPFATSRAEGSGLGLALVREVALAHGGDVHHRPRASLTCFEIELPWRAS